jgi:hypothetical protein
MIIGGYDWHLTFIKEVPDSNFKTKSKEVRRDE